jgi:hypothetical protein
MKKKQSYLILVVKNKLKRVDAIEYFIIAHNLPTTSELCDLFKGWVKL